MKKRRVFDLDLLAAFLDFVVEGLGPDT